MAPLSAARRQRLIALAYLTVIPLVIVVIAVLGAAQHFQTNTKTRQLARQNSQRITEIARLSREGVQAHEGICAFKEYLHRQVQASEQFLVDLAGGVRGPIPGITVNDIRAGIERQRQALASLKPVECERSTR